MARLDWTYEEVVLAADLVARNNWQGLRANNPKAQELSALLRAAPIHPAEGRPHNFRSVSSVQRKTFDIATQHPDYQGEPTRGGPHDAAVLLEFIAEPTWMHSLAAALRDQIAEPAAAGPSPDADLEELSRPTRAERWP